ncbi:MAG: PQQ-dependent sugar dehydrogenase [Bacteroidia bacterium]
MQETSDSPVETLLDSATLRAMANYQTYCASCHGEQMMAFADRQWKHGKERDSLVQSIADGYVDAGMPAWSAALTAQDIEEMADYILTGIEHVEKYGFEEITLSSDTFETEKLTFSLDTIVEGMDIPWGMTFLPSGELLVTEKKGILYLVDQEGNKTEVKGAPKVRFDSQGGLLDIVLHPDFETNHWLYISYSDIEEKDGETLSGTAINRYTWADNQLTEPVEIFKGKPYSKAQYHYGSKIVFDKDGYLFFTASDRANRDENPQTLTNPMGKIHRLKDDGSVPEDNPFVGQEDAVPSIYSYGHRNAQGLSIDPNTGSLWAHEHGPRGGDELNLIEPGKNYGWPVISYGINYDGTTFTNTLEKEGMEQPIHYWVPSIAPCGMTFVDSDKYPGWEGNILIGSLRFKYLNRVVVKGNQVISEEPLMKNIGRLRNVIQGPDGYIYVSVENPGYVFRLMPI